MYFIAVLTSFLIAQSLTIPNPVEENREGKVKTSPLVDATLAVEAQGTKQKTLERNSIRSDSLFGRLPLYFLENQEQSGESVAYCLQGTNSTLYFTDEGITYVLSSSDKETAGWTVKLDFVDANPGVMPCGKERQNAVFSYFRGKPEEWKTGIPAYARVVYEDLWPGIDLVYGGTANRLKYEFRVKPGADPSRIRLRYRGVEKVSVKDSGELVVMTHVGSFEDGKPFAYQAIDGSRTEISMTYALDEPITADHFTYGFHIGEYDHNQLLILDPVVLVYCGYVGGQCEDQGRSIAVDHEGYAYLAGITYSAPVAGFPVAVGPFLTFSDEAEGFVAKVNAQGTDLVYCGYIGGSDYDFINSIAVDGQGNAYVTGQTRSSETDGFPVVFGPDLTFNASNSEDAFVAKINVAGTGLDYCGYIGGTNGDRGYGIAVDGQGHAYVTGNTKSSESSFPVTVGPDLTYNGHYNGDAFIAKVYASGTGLDYCGYIGGSGGDTGRDVTVDSQGYVYVTGDTTSDETDGFPLVVGPNLIHGGQTDVFVTKLNAQGTDHIYCGYIGGSSPDYGYGVAVDGQGHAYVTGQTGSSEVTFPVTVGPGLTYGGWVDAFVAKVNAQGRGLDYCGYIGGYYTDYGNGIAVDSQGHAYVTGKTRSSEATFPVTVGPDLTYNSEDDAFVARVNAQGTGLDFCGYIGGSGLDEANDIALDSQGDVYVVGTTVSTEASFPVRVGPDLTYNGGLNGDDTFVAKITVNSLISDSSKLSVCGGTVNFALHGFKSNARREYLLLGTLSGTEPGILLPGGLNYPLNWDSFTTINIHLLNQYVFTDFFNNLDARGNGTAVLNAPPVNPGKIGKVMHFAYLLTGPPWDFVSNPVSVEFVP